MIAICVPQRHFSPAKAVTDLRVRWGSCSFSGTRRPSSSSHGCSSRIAGPALRCRRSESGAGVRPAVPRPSKRGDFEWPTTAEVGVTHERTAWPSICTGARAALREAATEKCGLFMPRSSTQRIEQRHVRFDVDRVRMAVDLKGEFLGHGTFRPPGRTAGFSPLVREFRGTCSLAGILPCSAPASKARGMRNIVRKDPYF